MIEYTVPARTVKTKALSITVTDDQGDYVYRQYCKTLQEFEDALNKLKLLATASLDDKDLPF